MKKLFLTVASCSLWAAVQAQPNPMEIPLYEQKIPNEKAGANEEKSEVDSYGILRITHVRKPTLTVFLAPAEIATGTAVVVCPGGGFGMLAAGHEGADIARKFNQMGVTAFVLKYRLPDPNTSPRPDQAPLQDAQQAIRVVRKRATEWKIAPNQIGIMGFSAGGHLASTAGTHFEEALIDNPEKTSVRPDFMLLIYPVISSDPKIHHAGSFENLLGKKPSAEMIHLYSNERQVTPQTPPTFLVHASDDDAVVSENSIVFYQALLRNHVPAEMHLYQKGNHGFGLTNRTTSDQWMDRCQNWLKSNGWLKK